MNRFDKLWVNWGRPHKTFLALIYLLLYVNLSTSKQINKIYPSLWDGSQKSISKFTPKLFNEIDSWAISATRFCHYMAAWVPYTF
jgi:hypothetical protein